MIVHADEDDAVIGADVFPQPAGHQKPIGAVHFNLNYVVHHVVHEKPTLTLAQPLLLEFKQSAPVRYGKQPKASFSL